MSDVCGTCLNYHYTEKSGHYHDYCVLDPERPCSYHCLACDSYDPDLDYIKFMRFGEENFDD